MKYSQNQTFSSFEFFKNIILSNSNSETQASSFLKLFGFFKRSNSSFSGSLSNAGIQAFSNSSQSLRPSLNKK